MRAMYSSMFLFLVASIPASISRWMDWQMVSFSNGVSSGTVAGVQETRKKKRIAVGYLILSLCTSIYLLSLNRLRETTAYRN